jgi:hypothetical protein
MKPITFPLPFFGLAVRIETVPAARRHLPPRRISSTLLKSAFSEALDRRLLQDIGLDQSRQD